MVILSYNTAKVTQKCLEHLYTSKDVFFETIVVDNDSKDESVEIIKKHFPQVKLIESKENLGFARGNNLGMSRALGKYILLLNSDCFVDPYTIKRCLDLQKDVLGCKLLNPDGSIQSSWGFFPSLRRVLQLMLFIDNLPVVRKFVDSIHIRDVARYENTRLVDWVMGAFILLKKEVFEKTRGFDEGFFMYGEEVEWLNRIKKMGYEVWYTPTAQATHIGRASQSDNFGAIWGEFVSWKRWIPKDILRIVLIGGCLVRPWSGAHRKALQKLVRNGL